MERALGGLEEHGKPSGNLGGPGDFPGRLFICKQGPWGCNGILFAPGTLFINKGLPGKPIGASMGKGTGRPWKSMESLREVLEALGIPQGGHLFINRSLEV